ncbi:MAG: hypothetical protein JOZ15_03680 [Acidobacteria bacterium]|nr:hypothetical protein [Acidobacteriota bacterium]
MRAPARAAGRISVAVAVAAVLGLAAPTAGCRRPDDRAAIRERLRSKGAAEVVREAATARYTPPAGGRLTAAQVRTYLAVRERECRIREAAALEPQRRRDAPAGAPADLRAAQELGVNPKEYAWVRDRVLEAETAATTQALYQKMVAGREQLLARMRHDRDALTDPQRRAAAEREIEDWKRGLQAAEPPMAPAVRANVALLARFRDPLAKLRALEERALAAAAGLEAPGGTAPRAGNGGTE